MDANGALNAARMFQDNNYGLRLLIVGTDPNLPTTPSRLAMNGLIGSVVDSAGRLRVVLVS